MHTLKRTFLNPNNYGWILLLFVILLLPNIFVTFFSSDLSGSIVKRAAYIVFSILILITPALFLKLRWYFIFESIFMLLAPFEIAYVLIYKTTVTDGYISSLINTNAGEATEFLLTIKWLCVILLITWTLYFLITFKKITNNYLFTRRYSIIIGLLFVLFNISLFSSMYILEHHRAKSEIRMDAVIDNYLSKYRKTYPCNLASILTRIYENHRLVSKMQKNIASFSYHAKQNYTPEREIYLVVIGESARYSNFSINGYARKTSPELEKNNNILSYSNVYSSSNVTEFTLPLLLSRATPLNVEKAYMEKTFVDAFGECGFHTAWIANQSSYYPYIKRIAGDVDNAYFSFNDFDAEENYDGILLKYIDTILNKNEQKTFIVVHTLGSHFRYNFRYPKAFEKFTPALKGTSDYSIITVENKPILINSYDNTILYTDFILSEIIKKIEAKECISAFLYISDHAENLYDKGSSLILHGTKNPSVEEVHVPLFIWTSPQYKDFHKSKQASLEANVNKKVSASNFFHSILDIADIHYPDENPEKSIASESFKEDSIRYVYTANKEIIHFQ